MVEPVGPTILQHPFVINIVLPFLLVFTVVFAVLQKTKVLGDKKKQIDAIVALVIGLIFVAVARAVDFTLNLIPFMAVALVVLLVFMVIWGMVYEPGKFEINKTVKTWIGVGVAIAVVIAVVLFSGFWEVIYERFVIGNNTLLFNVIIVIVVIAAIATVILGGKDKSGEKKEGS